MPASHSTTPHAEVTAFLQLAAEQFAAAGAAQAATDASIVHRVEGLARGVKATIPAGSPAEVTVTVDENAGLPTGSERGDYSAAKLAKFDAAFLAKTRKTVWAEIRSANRPFGSLSDEQADAMLAALGFSDIPADKTTVNFRIEGGEITRVLDGKKTEDEVIALMVQGGYREYSDGQAHATATFGVDNGNCRKTLPYRTLSVETERVWPDYTEDATS